MKKGILGLQIISAFLVLSLISACSTVRVKYQATIVDDYFQTAEFEFYESYPLKKLRRDCFLTAIFLGGACWKYLSQPSHDIKNHVAKNARRQIEDIFGPNNFGHRNISIDHFGWSDLPKNYQFTSGSPLRNNYPFYHRSSTSEDQIDDFPGIQ